MRIYQDVGKVGLFTYKSRKKKARQILFVEKRGPIIYLAALKMGAIRHAHPYYVIDGKLPPTPLEASGGPCFVTVALSGYLYLHVFNLKVSSKETY